MRAPVAGRSRLRPTLLAGLLLALGLTTAEAQTLRIGARVEPTIDPHYQASYTNQAYAAHVFEKLVDIDPAGNLIPGLAERWEKLGERGWRFHLRHGVKFHDGGDFTAADVKFSIARVPALPNNPANYAGNLRSIASVETPDPYTVDILTEFPNPVLPGQLFGIAIVSEKVATGKTSSDFASGAAAIGTGPFRFSRLIPSQEYELVRNDAYWGTKPAWEKVIFRVLPNDATRVAALLAGDIEMADFISPEAKEQLERNRNIRVHTGPATMIMTLAPNFVRDKLDDVAGPNGEPLTVNPFRDLRVRQAINLSLDREALVQRVLNGLGIPINQVVRPETPGWDPSLPPPTADTARARQLLAEAGYPDGLTITVSCSSGRYVADGPLCQAMGQMLTRGGFKAKVQVLPQSVIFSRLTYPDNPYGLSLLGWGSAGVEADSLQAIYHTPTRQGGYGVANRSGYTNETVDRLAELAARTMDDAKRDEIQREATHVATTDLGRIPLYMQKTIVATRPNIDYTTHVGQYTLAMNARPRP